MAVSQIVSFDKRSSLLQVVVVFSVGSSGGGQLAGVLSQSVDHSVVDFGQFLKTKVLTLRQLAGLGFQLLGKGFFKGFASGKLTLLLLLSFLILPSDCIVLQFVGIQLEGVVVIGHQLQVSVQLISESSLLNKKSITPPCLMSSTGVWQLKGKWKMLLSSI